jgi:flagellar biosynthetic protein FlhB
MADDVERTEQPTPRKRGEARRQGQVAVSQEVLAVGNLLAVTLALSALASGALARGGALFRTLWVPIDELDPAQATALLRSAFGAGAALLAPIFAVAVGSALLLTLAQTRGNIAAAKLRPRLENLDPMKGLRRILRVTAPIELAKSVVKLAIVGGAMWLAVRSRLPQYLGLPELPLLQALGFQLGTVLWALLVGSLALVVVAAGDFAYVFWRTEQALKMSRSEIRDERRQQEGDPLVRARLRSLQLERARSRMMRAVPKADVVVTNPEHFAVALVYRREQMQAPKVVAKGRNWLALRIREVARGAGVPTVENPPLARALYRSVKVGQVIPEKLYRAVAEVLGFVYRIDRARARSW